MMMRTLLALLLALISARAFSGEYFIRGECDGYPRVQVGSIDGTCIGLVYQDLNKKVMVKPRLITEIGDSGSFLITDMGGWSDNRGKLLLLRRAGSDFKIEALLSKLNLPHGLSNGPGDTYLVGEKDQIIQITVNNNKIASQRVVISDLPSWEKHLHPLTHFIVDDKYNLIVNTGASTDQCIESRGDLCEFAENAGLRRYKYNEKLKVWDKSYSVLASGLRNSMAMVRHNSGTLLQIENSMDFKEATEPYEEINIIEQGNFYGWPYCYNNRAINPDWETAGKDICNNDKKYSTPWTLLPPHVAPLGAIYYQSDKIKQLSGKLLISWHGYRIVGNRLVAYDIDELGRPLRQSKAYYYSDPYDGKGFVSHEFNPKGGLTKVSQHKEVISHWNKIEGVRPEGAPVGMTIASDGSLWIVDDKNRAILRLSSGEAYVDGTDQVRRVQMNVIPPRVNEVLQSRCSGCHNELLTEPSSLINSSMWLSAINGRLLIEERVFFDKVRPMPLGSSLSSEDKEILMDFIDEYKRSISK